MSSILEELQKVAREKYEALSNIQSERCGMERDLKREVEKKVREKFGEAENKASAESAKAYAALKAEQERIRFAESEAKIPYPVGTKMVFWERERFGEGWRAPCVYGVLEIFKQGDEYPENLRWNAPNVGDIIVRLMTKDGKLGKKTEKYGQGRNRVWIPEGQSPA
jgi:hypothetical protein